MESAAYGLRVREGDGRCYRTAHFDGWWLTELDARDGAGHLLAYSLTASSRGLTGRAAVVIIQVKSCTIEHFNKELLEGEEMTQTLNPKSPVAPDRDGADFVAAVQFKSPPDRVLPALTDAARLSSWWVQASGSGLEGGELTFLFPVEKLIIRVDAANSSIVQWTPLVCEPVPDWVGTTITFVLSPTEEGGSLLNFRHARLAQLECFDMCRKGWEHYLPSLVDHVDAGLGNPDSIHTSS